MKITDLLRNKIYRDCHVGTIGEFVTLRELECSEWSPEFEQLMRNRLIMGAMRYGRFGDPEKGKYDHVRRIIEKAKLYAATGNDELLVDIANYALVEFATGSHPLKHWTATDDLHHAKEQRR